MVTLHIARKASLSIILVLLYLASAMFWVGMLFVTSEGLWAPWDVAPVRPPEGHWQSRIGGFFEAGPGMYLPAVIFFLVQFALLLFTIIRRGGVRLTSLVYLVLNVAAVFGLGLVSDLIDAVVTVPSHLTESDWKYHGDFIRELPYTIVTVLTLLGLWILPPYIVFKKKLTLGSDSELGAPTYRP